MTKTKTILALIPKDYEGSGRVIAAATTRKEARRLGAAAMNRENPKPRWAANEIALVEVDATQNSLNFIAPTAK